MNTVFQDKALELRSHSSKLTYEGVPERWRFREAGLRQYYENIFISNVIKTSILA